MATAGAGVLMEKSLNLSEKQVGGDALGLLAALFYAGYILIVGRLTRFISIDYSGAEKSTASLKGLCGCLAEGGRPLAGGYTGWLPYREN